MTLVVTPEVLRSTAQAIESALQNATLSPTVISSSHEGLGSAVWGGQAHLALGQYPQRRSITIYSRRFRVEGGWPLTVWVKQQR